MIHPDTLAVITPTVTEAAFVFATLLDQAYSPSNLGSAVLASSIIRRTSHNGSLASIAVIPIILIPVAVASPAPPHFEIRPTAAVHPNALVIVSPAGATTTLGLAALLYQAHSATCISGTIAAIAIVGRAANQAFSPAPAAIIVPAAIIPAVIAQYEISAAAMVHPNALVIEAPTVTLRARRFTPLLY
jgi:hypothetical protein